MRVPIKISKVCRYWKSKMADCHKLFKQFLMLSKLLRSILPFKVVVRSNVQKFATITLKLDHPVQTKIIFTAFSGSWHFKTSAMQQLQTQFGYRYGYYTSYIIDHVIISVNREQNMQLQTLSSYLIVSITNNVTAVQIKRRGPAAEGCYLHCCDHYPPNGIIYQCDSHLLLHLL